MWFPMKGPAVWTGMTNDSWTNDGDPTGEPQACSSVVWDCDETSGSRTGTVSCPLGYVASDMCDTVFKCLAPPCISDGTLPRCVLVGTGQEFDGLETYTRVWNDSTFLKMNNHPLMGSSEGSIASGTRFHFAGRMPCPLPRELQGQVQGNIIDHPDTPL